MLGERERWRRTAWVGVCFVAAWAGQAEAEPFLGALMTDLAALDRDASVLVLDGGSRCHAALQRN